MLGSIYEFIKLQKEGKLIVSEGYIQVTYLPHLSPSAKNISFCSDTYNCGGITPKLPYALLSRFYYKQMSETASNSDALNGKRVIFYGKKYEGASTFTHPISYQYYYIKFLPMKDSNLKQ
jgi:hypothetical protein